MGGQVYDVDAYKDEDSCAKAYIQTTEILDEARKARPELDYSISHCIPIQVADPSLKPSA